MTAPAPAPARRSDASTWAIAAAGPVLLAVDGLLWASSRVVSVASGQGWSGTPGQPAALLTALRAGRGTTTPVLVVAALLAVLLASPALLAWRARRRRPAALLGRARWATRRDLAPLAVDGAIAAPGRIGLGVAHAGGARLAAEPRHSLVVLGPSGSGKTESVVIPALHAWTGPAVVTSVKDDVLRATEQVRAGLGPVWVFDPTNSTGRASSTWSPLAACTTWPGASQMAGWLVGAAAGSSTGNGDHERFWSPLARKLLAPLMFAAGATGLPMAEVIRWLDTQEHTEVVGLLDDLGVVEACNAFTASRKRPGDTLGSVYSTAEACLDVYTDPDVAASALTSQIDPVELLDSAGTLYLVAPLHAQDRLRPLFEALVMSVVREAQNRAQAGAANPTGAASPGLLLMLDECRTAAPLRDLPALAATGRGQGIQLVSVFQDRGQIEQRYGRLADSVLTNHRAKLALSGIADLGTLDYFSKLLGDTDVDRHSVTDSTTGRSTSTSQQRERLAPADALRQLPLGAGLLVYGSLPPARVRFPLPAVRHLSRPDGSAVPSTVKRTNEVPGGGPSVTLP